MSTEKNNGSPEQNQEVLRRVIEEGFNKGNYAALDTHDGSRHQSWPFHRTAYRQTNHHYGHGCLSL
jgi:hypothetical protein